MKQFAKHGMVLVAVMGVLLGTGAYFHRDGLHPNTSVDTMLLLIPDSANMEDPLIREWLDAADEVINVRFGAGARFGHSNFSLKIIP